jgi:hypothetical protein
MKFMLLMLPTVPGTLEDRKRLRPIGRNNERYQQMLEELRKPNSPDAYPAAALAT